MSALRWIAFLPTTVLLVALAQLVTGTVAEKLPALIAFPLVFFFGIFLFFASFVPCRIAPNRAIGATIFLSIFLLLETMAFLSKASSLGFSQLLIRLYTDLAIVLGALGAAKADSD